MPIIRIAIWAWRWRQVVKFLNDVHNRSLIRGVIAAGNTNFGEA